MGLSLVCLSASAYDFKEGGIFYDIPNLTEKEVTVTYGISYNSYSGVVHIPSKVVHNHITYNVTHIGKSAFKDCTNLIAVTIPNSVTEIGVEAFYNCTNIRSLTIGSNVKSIDNKAFYEKEGMYTIPKVFWLGNTPPIGSYGIKAEMNYVSNTEFSLSNKKVYPFLRSRFEVDNVVYVPVSPSERTCDVIDCNYAPTSSEIVIDSIVKNKNIELKVLNVNRYSFYNNDSITKLTISNSGNIGDYSFYNCDDLTSVVANNDGNIGEYAFYDCKKLLTADLSNFGNIGNSTFYNCKKLNSVTFGNNIYSIGSKAFYDDNSLQEINLPNNIMSLGESAFSGCSSLINVTIGSSIAILPEQLFKNCSSLTSLTIPVNILNIEDYVFEYCTKLRNLTFSQISNRTKTFPYWTSTNHNNYSSSSQEYSIDVQAGDVLSFEIWSDSYYGHKLTVYLNGTTIATISGLSKSQIIAKSFSTDQTLSLKVEYTKDYGDSGRDEAGIRNITINYPYITLGRCSRFPLFHDCPLDEVVIGRKLSYNTSSNYGYSPFYRNTSLRSVKISDIEDTIYDNEFYGCSNLQVFECGDGVTSIGNRAFSGCSALKSYLSGTSVKRIGQEAFSDCTAMTSFTTNAAVPPVCGNQALDDINKWECTLHVPQESIDDYQAAEQWKEFFFIEASGVEDVIADNENYSECPVEIYNLSGNKVGSSKENLSPGIYIMRQGRKVEKIMIQ